MDEKVTPEVRILASVNILNGIAVSGEENLAKLVTVIRELKAIATELHENQQPSVNGG